MKTNNHYLHLDNDTAGRLAAKAIMAVMPEGYRVENKPPPRGKDVNDFLCHRLGDSHSGQPQQRAGAVSCRFPSFDRFSLLQIVIIYVNIKAVR